MDPGVPGLVAPDLGPPGLELADPGMVDPGVVGSTTQSALLQPLERLEACIPRPKVFSSSGDAELATPPDPTPPDPAPPDPIRQSSRAGERATLAGGGDAVDARVHPPTLPRLWLEGAFTSRISWSSLASTTCWWSSTFFSILVTSPCSFDTSTDTPPMVVSAAAFGFISCSVLGNQSSVVSSKQSVVSSQ